MLDRELHRLTRRQQNVTQLLSERRLELPERIFKILPYGPVEIRKIAKKGLLCVCCDLVPASQLLGMKRAMALADMSRSETDGSGATQYGSRLASKASSDWGKVAEISIKSAAVCRTWLIRAPARS